MKKKILICLLLLCSIFALTGCKKDEEKTYKLDWNVPTGFSSKDGTIYLSSDYPMDTSNIVFGKAEDTGIRPDATQEEVEVELQKNMYKIFAKKVEVDINVFEKVELDGFDGLHIEASCVYEGIEMTQICYIYECGDAAYTIAYTYDNDKEWEVLFRESASSIRIIETESEKKK